MLTKADKEDKAFENLMKFETYLQSLQSLKSSLEWYRARYNAINWQMAELVAANGFELHIPNCSGDLTGTFRHALKHALDQGHLTLSMSNTVEIHCSRTSKMLGSLEELNEELNLIAKDWYGENHGS